jgi:hypothetical protein
MQSTDLWSICTCGAAGERFLFSWRWHSIRKTRNQKSETRKW